MNNFEYERYGIAQGSHGHLQIGWDLIEVFGGSKSLLIALLVSLDGYAKRQGNDKFFATIEFLTRKLKMSDKTIKAYMRELKDLGILDEGERAGGMDNRKFYQIDYACLGSYVLQNLSENQTPIDKGKSTPNDKGNFTPIDKGNFTPIDKGKSTPIYNNKESTILESTILKNNSDMPLNVNENPPTENPMVESNKKNKTFAFKTPKILDLQSSLELADDLFENAKNDFDSEIRDLWLQFINNKFAKLKELKKKMTDSMIRGNFNDLYKLKDLGIDLRERLNKASSESWRGLIFDSDKNHTFKNQNKKPEYNPRTGNTGESVFSDNPDDYINENMAGVTKIADGVFEADLFKLTGRKA